MFHYRRKLKWFYVFLVVIENIKLGWSEISLCWGVIDPCEPGAKIWEEMNGPAASLLYRFHLKARIMKRVRVVDCGAL